jgi:protein-tyrosine phosphatase
MLSEGSQCLIRRYNTMYEICPRVFFGSAGATYDPEQMKKITHVVNCDSIRDSTSTLGQTKHFLFLESYDDENFNILEKHLDKVYMYIDEAHKDPKANVYIHCYMGWKRSASLSIGYVCKKTNISAKNLIETIRKERDILDNEYFEQSLLHMFP